MSGRLIIIILLCSINSYAQDVFHFKHKSQSYYAFPEYKTRHLMKVTLDFKTCREEVAHYRSELVKAGKIIGLKDSIELSLDREIATLHNIIKLKDNQIDNKALQVRHFQDRFRNQRRQKWGMIAGAVLAAATLFYISR